MADHDDWTADDDAQLRAALTSLRADVEASPLPDVRFVKARGQALRRRRFLTVGAAAAAAVIVAGTVGYAALDREPDQGTVAPPAARNTATSPDPTPTVDDSLDIPGILPVDGEWQDALGLPAGSVQVSPVTKGGGVECGPALGAPKAQVSGSVEGVDSLTVGGAYWPEADQKGAEAKTAAAIETCENGPDFSTTKERVSNAVIYSYVAGDAGVGWYAVVTGGQGVALLTVSENGVAKSRFTADQLEALASAAQARLDRYATATSAPTKKGSSGPKAVDEVMQVSGPAPVPASKYFVAASQWSDPLLGPGGKTYAGQGNPDDSLGDIGVFCETNDFLSGFGGRLGEVEIQSGPGDGNVIGHQRVRIDDADTGTPAGAAMAKESVNTQLAQETAQLVKGCAESDGKVTASKGPTEGTFLLTKKVAGEATGTDYRWVGVTALTSPAAWTTVVFHGTDDGQGFQGSAAEGFAELDRLLALARQK